MYKGKRATARQVAEAIEKYRKHAFGKRQLVIITNRAYMIPGTYHLGRVQIYDVATKQLLMKAPNNHTAIKMLEDGYTFDKSPVNGLFRTEGQRRKRLRDQRQRNMDAQGSALALLRKGDK